MNLVNESGLNISFTDDGLDITGSMPDTIRSGLGIGAVILARLLMEMGADDEHGAAFLQAFGDFAIQAAEQVEEQIAMAKFASFVAEVLAEETFEEEQFDLFDVKHSGE